MFEEISRVFQGSFKGVLRKFQGSFKGVSSQSPVIGPEEMPILVWGRRKRPQTKMGST